VSEQLIYEIDISAQLNFNQDKVSDEELNLINAFFLEIFNEMMQYDEKN
jgi:hypothetical protein